MSVVGVVQSLRGAIGGARRGVGPPEPVPVESFGAYLKRLRCSRGLTLRQVAEAAELEPARLYQLEAGRIRRPQVSTISRLCFALDGDIDEMRAAAGRPAIAAHSRPRRS
jgi:transcriptional regulator with XRE-family HTH domain